MPLRRTRQPAERLFDADVVDVVGVAADGTTELFVGGDRPWTGSDAQIRSLQEKINAYVSYVVDGSLASTYPEQEGAPWRVVVACQMGPPDARTAAVLDRTVEPVRRYGGDLSLRT